MDTLVNEFLGLTRDRFWRIKFMEIYDRLDESSKQKLHTVMKYLVDNKIKFDHMEPNKLLEFAIVDGGSLVKYLRFSQFYSKFDPILERSFFRDVVLREMIVSILDIWEAYLKDTTTRDSLDLSYDFSKIVDSIISGYGKDHDLTSAMNLFWYVNRKIQDIPPNINLRILGYILSYKPKIESVIENIYTTPVELRPYMIRKLLLWTDAPKEYEIKMQRLQNLFDLNRYNNIKRIYDVVLRGEIDKRVLANIEGKDTYVYELKILLSKYTNDPVEAMLNILDKTKREVDLKIFKIKLYYKLDLRELEYKLRTLSRSGRYRLDPEVFLDDTLLFDRINSFSRIFKMLSRKSRKDMEDIISRKITYRELISKLNENLNNNINNNINRLELLYRF
ncbi:MAG: hypothetical protein QW465_00695 [Candidatus Anstonellales archaeon]